MRHNDPRRTVLRRQRLLDLRRVLARDYWKEREASLAYAQRDAEDEIDRAVRTHTRDCFLTFSEIERRELMLIDEALRRLDAGTYGLCECGHVIQARRLEAIPWAATCYRCQVKHEAPAAGAGPGPAEAEEAKAAA